MTRAWTLGLLALAGCGAPDAEVTGAGAAPVPVDSSLVDLLADLALADARSALADPARRAGVRDSLRTVALRAHDVSEADAQRRQERLADDPSEARATFDAVERALVASRTP